ncbi:hypothetical protein LWI28_013274 [Acer negundo]|uniref:UBC core domain-containing protein n=1 Tax=Acer negundo TaxID=4023 RepID=A0AAD5NLN4_ACENE|nr:hypothetical protein LWI28_013274 [Acer negundo]
MEKQKENYLANGGGPPVKKQTAGELRLNKDIAELNLPQTCTIEFPNGKDDLMNFEVSVKPDEGYYKDGKFLFTFQVPPMYPHEPPKVKCKTTVDHLIPFIFTEIASLFSSVYVLSLSASNFQVFHPEY